MSSADLLEDGFPHGTPEGYDRGCRGAGCPGQAAWGFSCTRAWMSSKGDYRYTKLARQGLTPAEIAAELDGTPAPPKTPTPTEEQTMDSKPTPKPAPPKKKAPPPRPVPEIDEEQLDTSASATGTSDPNSDAVVLGYLTPLPATAEPATTAPEADDDPEQPKPAKTPSRTAAIRAWAKTKGYKIAEKGRIPAHIVEHYDQVHANADEAEPATPEPTDTGDSPTRLCASAGGGLQPGVHYLCSLPQDHTGDHEAHVGDLTVAIWTDALIPDDALAAYDHAALSDQLDEVRHRIDDDVPTPHLHIEIAGSLTHDQIAAISREITGPLAAGHDIGKPARPDWGTVAAAQDVERARNLAVRLEQELARAEAERDAAIARAHTAETALETTLERWDRQRIELAYHRLISAMHEQHNQQLMRSVSLLLEANYTLARDLHHERRKNTHLTDRPAQPRRARRGWWRAAS